MRPCLQNIPFHQLLRSGWLYLQHDIRQKGLKRILISGRISRHCWSIGNPHFPSRGRGVATRGTSGEIVALKQKTTFQVSCRGAVKDRTIISQQPGRQSTDTLQQHPSRERRFVHHSAITLLLSEGRPSFPTKTGRWSKKPHLWGCSQPNAPPRINPT